MAKNQSQSDGLRYFWFVPEEDHSEYACDGYHIYTDKMTLCMQIQQDPGYMCKWDLTNANKSGEDSTVQLV